MIPCQAYNEIQTPHHMSTLHKAFLSAFCLIFPRFLLKIALIALSSALKLYLLGIYSITQEFFFTTENISRCLEHSRHPLNIY